MQDEMRDLLRRVSEGEITPEEAEREIARLRGEEPVPVPEPASRPPSTATGTAIQRVRVVGMLGGVDVVGDPTVVEASADGPHRARYEGDALILEGDFEDTLGFTFIGPLRFGAGPRGRLLIRMNPDLALAVKLEAASLRVREVRGSISAEVSAGSVRLDGFDGPLDLNVKMGSVNARGLLNRGSSRINCELGSVTVNLDPRSDVRIRARSSMGSVRLPRSYRDGRRGSGGSAEVVMGSGAAQLDIDCSMGSIRVGEE